jgi:Fe2+ transport system protein FeoA
MVLGEAGPVAYYRHRRTSAGRHRQSAIPEAFYRGFPIVHTSQTGVTLVVVRRQEQVRIELELKMIFNFIFGRKRHRDPATSALADLKVGEHAIVRELELDHPIAEHLMNLGFVPGLEVSVERSGPGGDPRVYRVEGTEVAMRRELSRHIQVSLVGAPAFGD